MQSAGAGIERHAMLHFAELRKLMFEALDFFAKDEAGIAAHAIKRRQYFIAQRSIFSFEIEIRNHGGNRWGHVSLFQINFTAFRQAASSGAGGSAGILRTREPARSEMLDGPGTQRHQAVGVVGPAVSIALSGSFLRKMPAGTPALLRACGAFWGQGTICGLLRRRNCSGGLA